MALTFPSSPTNGQIFTSGGQSWRYDGKSWVGNTTPLGQYVSRAGDTMTGHLVAIAGATGNQVPRRSEVAGLTTNSFSGAQNAPAFNVVSDLRTKTEIEPFYFGLPAIKDLEPILFTRDGRRHLGFSAQSVQRAVPHGTVQDSAGFLSIDVTAVLAATVSAVQSHEIRLNALYQIICEHRDAADA